MPLQYGLDLQIAPQWTRVFAWLVLECTVYWLASSFLYKELEQKLKPGNKNKKSSDLMVYHTNTEGSMDQTHFLKTVSNIFQLKHAFINDIQWYLFNYAHKSFHFSSFSFAFNNVLEILKDQCMTNNEGNMHQLHFLQMWQLKNSVLERIWVKGSYLSKWLPQGERGPPKESKSRWIEILHVGSH